MEQEDKQAFTVIRAGSAKSGKSRSLVDRSRKLKKDHNLGGLEGEAEHEIFRRPRGLHNSHSTNTNSHVQVCAGFFSVLFILGNSAAILFWLVNCQPVTSSSSASTERVPRHCRSARGCNFTRFAH